MIAAGTRATRPAACTVRRQFFAGSPWRRRLYLASESQRNGNPAPVVFGRTPRAVAGTFHRVYNSVDFSARYALHLLLVPLLLTGHDALARGAGMLESAEMACEARPDKGARQFTSR